MSRSLCQRHSQDLKGAQGYEYYIRWLGLLELASRHRFVPANMTFVSPRRIIHCWAGVSLQSNLGSFSSKGYNTYSKRRATDICTGVPSVKTPPLTSRHFALLPLGWIGWDANPNLPLGLGEKIGMASINEDK